MKFSLEAQDPRSGELRTFDLDDEWPFLFENGREFNLEHLGGFKAPQPPSKRMPSYTTHPDYPSAKTHIVERLLIQVGFACNYSCAYCSQATVTGGVSGNPADVARFMAMLEHVQLGDFNDGEGVTAELWGGEPLVYWKTLKPLVEALRTKFPALKFSMVTNGSLLTPEKVDFIEAMDISVALSHDGPGQSVRGPDPFDDPVAGPAIRDLYRRRRPKHKISFSAMLHADSYRRTAIVDFFREKTGDPFVVISEGGFVLPYHETGMRLTPHDPSTLFSIRRSLYEELVEHPELAANFWILREDMQKLMRSFAYRHRRDSVPQLCGKDREGVVTVDLAGNVLTCHQVSADTVAANGASHRIGHISDLAGVRLNTSVSWHHRASCQTCPVVRLCGGRCMYLQGAEFAAACEAAYSEKVAVFAAAFRMLTGCHLLRIRSPHLPLHRQILWDGEHPELMGAAQSASPVHKTIPIRAVRA